MSGLRFIGIDGKHRLRRDLFQLRHEQRKAYEGAQQPALFERKDDTRPIAERTAAGRYWEPSLFSG